MFFGGEGVSETRGMIASNMGTTPSIENTAEPSIENETIEDSSVAEDHTSFVASFSREFPCSVRRDSEMPAARFNRGISQIVEEEIEERRSANPATEIRSEIITDPDEITHIVESNYLIILGDSESRIPPNPDPETRISAVQSLAKADSFAIETLEVVLFHEPDNRVVIAAVRELGLLGYNEPVPRLIRILEGVREGQPQPLQPELQREIILALGRINDSRAIQPIAELLEDGFIYSENLENTIEILSNIPHPRAARALLILSQRAGDQHVRQLASTAYAERSSQ